MTLLFGSDAPGSAVHGVLVAIAVRGHARPMRDRQMSSAFEQSPIGTTLRENDGTLGTPTGVILGLVPGTHRSTGFSV